jgi:tetratricopeptide (TPR) repeat protein
VWNGWRLALLEGSYEAALAELQAAERLDPLDLKVKTQIGYVHYFLRDFPRALAQFRSVLNIDPQFAFGYYALGDVHAQQGELDLAIEAFAESARLGGSSANHLALLAHVHGLAGHAYEARRLLAELQQRAQAGHASPIWVALAHVGLGETDAAFARLDQAFLERDGSLILVTASPEFDRLRGDERFRALLARMGLAHRAA